MSPAVPAKRRKAGEDGGGDGGDGGALPPGLSRSELVRLVDRRVAEVVESRTAELEGRVDALRRENEGLRLKCESLERSVRVLKKERGGDAGEDGGRDGPGRKGEDDA